MTNTLFPPTCVVSGWTLIFAQEQVPRFIAAQHEWAKEKSIHAYGDDPPETPYWVEDERSGNPLLTALPLHPLEVGTLLAVVEGMGIYAILRDRDVDVETNIAGPRVYTFAIVAPEALEKGVAMPDQIAKPGEQTCWPAYPVRIRESRLRKEAPDAWAHLKKSALRLAAKQEEGK